MQKVLKIFVGIIALLGLLSFIFILTAKKKAVPAATPQIAQTQKQTAPATPKIAAVPITSNNTIAKPATTAVNVQTQKNIIRTQWQQCKSKTTTISKNLFWNVQIYEGIPAGGTYAKGNLNNDSTLPVRIIIKSDSQIIDKIKPMLFPGKTAFLRINCTDVATDGSVVVQAF